MPLLPVMCVPHLFQISNILYGKCFIFLFVLSTTTIPSYYYLSFYYYSPLPHLLFYIISIIYIYTYILIYNIIYHFFYFPNILPILLIELFKSSKYFFYASILYYINCRLLSSRFYTIYGYIFDIYLYKYYYLVLNNSLLFLNYYNLIYDFYLYLYIYLFTNSSTAYLYFIISSVLPDSSGFKWSIILYVFKSSFEYIFAYYYFILACTFLLFYSSPSLSCF